MWEILRRAKVNVYNQDFFAVERDVYQKKADLLKVVV